MKINPFSALVGAASLGVVLLTVSAFQVSVSKSPTQQMLGSLGISIDGPIQVEGIPTPSQMMRVVEGTSYSVPSGKVFVATGLGRAGNDNSDKATLRIDGVPVAQSLPAIGSSNDMNDSTTIRSLPPGMAAKAGQSVSVETDSSSGGGIVLGYLADE